MRNLLHIFIVPLLLTWSHQYSVELDENENGLIYQTFREIYLKNSTLTLIYEIDISILYKISSNKFFLENCNQTKQINLKLTPKQQNLDTKNTHFIKLELSEIDQLRIFYDEIISKNSTNQCKNISNILFNFNVTMQRVELNAKHIFDIIRIEKFMADVEKLTEKTDKGNLSFRFDKSFSNNFINTSKLIFSKTTTSFQIGFAIPIHTKINLFRMYSKPILYNKKPFIYTPNFHYASKIPDITLFSKETYKRNCFWSKDLKKTFCKDKSPFRECDQKILLHQKVDIYSDCFTKLPITNYVTQIKNNLYFTIQTPLDLNITCANKTKKLYFEQSSNILGISNCSLETQNFILNTNASTEHRIMAITNTDKNTNKYALLYYFYAFVLCFLLIPNILFMTFLILRRKDLPECNNNNTNTVTYVSLETDPYGYDSLPLPYRESLI